MTTAQIKAMQTRLGLVSDGFWGPKSVYACQTWLRMLMPKPHPWPVATEASLANFYGDPGDERLINALDVTDLGLDYEGAAVRSIRCHTKVAASLHRVLTAIAKSPFADILRQYDGCFCDRPMRGGTSPSLHARGAAIDLCAAGNGNLAHWPDAAGMSLDVMAIFAREGWLAAGAFWGRDAMHFQATR